MTLDLTDDQEKVMTRLKTLCGGRVYTFIRDEDILERDESGDIKPYIAAMFGEPVPKATDRSLAGEEEQPYVWPVMLWALGATDKDVDSVANAIRPLMIGWSPSDNCSAFRGRGGGSFSDRQAAARPTIASRLLTFDADMNMSVN